MTFRECRLGVLLEIMREVNSDIDARKCFLISGGMRNAYYVMAYRKMKMWGLCGCGETNVPGIFELLDIPYEVINSEKFWDTFRNDENKDEKFYVLPVVRSVLNTESVEMEKYNLIGHSYFLVSHIEKDRMYFRTIYQKDITVRMDEYYITQNVFSQMNNNSEWIKEAEFEGYIIKKSDLKECKKLQDLAAKSELELLEMNIQKFLLNEKNVGAQRTERYDGEQTYEALQRYFEEMLSFNKKVEGTNKEQAFKNFIYIQLANFRKMLVSGTDGYYRTEFLEILSSYSKYSEYVEEWNQIIALWRNLGRALAVAQSKKVLFEKTETILNNILSIWKDVAAKEMALINRMQKEILGKVS